MRGITIHWGIQYFSEKNHLFYILFLKQNKKKSKKAKPFTGWPATRMGGCPPIGFFFFFFFSNLIFFFFFIFKMWGFFLVILIGFQLKYMSSYQTKE
jgi:hypothetical protein